MTQDGTGTHRATSTDSHVPEALKTFDIWVVWNGHIKQPLAPWATDHLFPAEWGEGLIDDPDADMDERPESDYETAARVCELPASELEYIYSRTPQARTRNGDDLVAPDTLTPTIILPHDPPDPPITLVDLDDVRDPDTGEITSQAHAIIERLGGYVEISSSGTGLHSFVRAALPDGIGRVVEPLDGGGHLELYDHGRVVGATWQHVDGTPTDVPHRQDRIEEVIDEHVGRDPHPGVSSSAPASNATPDHLAQPAGTVDVNDQNPEHDRDDVENPYYRLDITDVADRGHFRRHRSDAPGDAWQGPHPGHGATSARKRDEDSSNFNVRPDTDQWYCFAHNTGGGALELIAVLEGLLDCEQADQLSRHPRVFAHTCLLARDEYACSLADAEPPYRALVGIARAYDLSMDDEKEGILGRLTYEAALSMYEALSPDEFEA